MKSTHQSINVTMPRFWQVYAMACAVTVLPMGVVDAKPAKKKAEKKMPAPMTVREFSQKVRAEVKAGKLTKKEGKAKLADYKKKVGGNKKDASKNKKKKK
jgi:hypothetical protein